MSSSNSYAYAARRRNGGSAAVGGQSVGGSTTGIDAKVVIMGDPGVGKTSLVHRYTTNTFSAARTAATPGAQFHTKKTAVDGTNVRLQIWDTAGQERFRSMAPMYYRGANAAVVVYDITTPSTLESVKMWLEELKKNTTPDSDLIIYIVGAKSDLRERRAVTLEDARRKLLTWFPPPERSNPPTPPPPPTSSTLIPYLGPGYPFTSTSSIYPSTSTAFSIPNQLTASLSNTLSIPAQLSNFSNQLPTLPTLPSFNIRRPRFTSLTSSKSAIPISPEPPAAAAAETSSNSNIASTPSSATSNSTHMAASSASQLPQSPIAASSALPTNSHLPRVVFPRSQTTAAFTPSISHLGPNMAGSHHSGFARHGGAGGQRHGHGHSNSVAAFVGLGDDSGIGAASSPRSNMVRRNTTSAGPHSAASRSAALLMMSNGNGSGCASGSASGDERFGKQWKSGIGRKDDVLEDSSGVDDDIDTGDVSEADDELPAGMELFEVSAKDNDGVPNLFAAVIQAIIKRRHKIEEERSLRDRDSIMLGSPSRPWGGVAEEDDDDDDDPSGKKKKGWGMGWGSCCTS